MFETAAVRALILSIIAGMSTMIGSLIVILVRKKSEKILTMALGFAAGVMLSVSFLDLYPTGLEFLKNSYGEKISVVLSVLFLIVGTLLAGGIDRFVPHEEYDESLGEAPHKNLFRVGFVSMLAIGLHNFPEGIATFMAGYEDMALGISITVAIALHNIPEGIAVAMPIYFATENKKKAFKYTFISGIAEPIGALLAFLLLRQFMSPAVLGATLNIVAGIMIYIAIEELIPSSRQYGNDRLAMICTLAGVCIMPLTHII